MKGASGHNNPCPSPALARLAMPELPEVEVTRRSFEGRIAGARIVGASLGKPLRWPLGCSVESLAGRRVLGVDRRGKYLLLRLDQGLLVLHLGMSGSLSFAPALPAGGPHDHFDLLTDAGQLRLHDPRRFGAVVWAPAVAVRVSRQVKTRLEMGRIEVPAIARQRGPLPQKSLSNTNLTGACTCLSR